MESIKDELDKVIAHILQREATLDSLPPIAPTSHIRAAGSHLPTALPDEGWGLSKVIQHLLHEIAPGMAPAQCGPRYFGFVTGGVTPAAQLADLLVTSYDANVQVHLPNETIVTTLENRTLEFVLDLLGLDRATFPGRTLTTGATASNVLGLACGREFAVRAVKGEGYSVADEGLAGCQVRLFHADGHASVGKAAALVGIGRKHCHNLAAGSDRPEFDLKVLEEKLAEAKRDEAGAIVVCSIGEVNTGRFTGQLAELRDLCGRYGAWLHMDAAFGAFTGFSVGLEYADSITTDAHKWLNVPYDCGIFFTRRLDLLQASVTPTFTPGTTPTYLLSTADLTLPSPLMVGIENSRRFRALPLYATLLSLGKRGHDRLFADHMAFAARVAAWVAAHPGYVLMNGEEDGVSLNVVLFRAVAGPEEVRDTTKGGVALAARINGSGKMYVSPTVWKGVGAVRLAVCNWRTGKAGLAGRSEDDDFNIVTEVLEGVLQ
ncbi:hypothetical protein HDU96_003237 [Phlyctochytrium bullatum]|nr:hypothetical protein HDU96_003237 [Phlyctochytrium bullatum]